MQYRREIDGLRAVAVLPVVFYHAGFHAFNGGFVGVDVFFVISGYLITSIITNDLERGKFSVKDFYERRARRILPACFLMMFVCIPFAWVSLLPLDMLNFSQNLIAVSLFVSNIFFWRRIDYFNAEAELNPLIHTWSLAVEEHYYLIFPLFLKLIWGIGWRRVVIVLILLTMVSLSIAQWGASAKPIANFYLLPSRAWEILFGALAAFYLSRAQVLRVSPALREFGSIAGLLLLGYSIFTFNDNTPMPSVYALAPTIGTLLIIIFSTKDTVVGKLLGTMPLVGLGLISYSSYLWHQPIFALARHRDLSAPRSIVFLLLSVLCFLIGFLSWKYVEIPFRKHGGIKKSVFIRMSIVSALALLFFGYIGVTTDGFAFRVPNAVKLISSPEEGGISSCKWGESKEPCFLGDKKAKVTVAMVGDSHTGALRKALSEDLERRGVAALSFGDAWCVPLYDVGTTYRLKNPDCRILMKNNLLSIAGNPEIKWVLLHAEWSAYTSGSRLHDRIATDYTDPLSVNRGLQENVKVIERGLNRTIEMLLAKGKRVVIIKSIPEQKGSVPKFFAKNLWHNGSTEIGNFAVNRNDLKLRNFEIERIFSKVTNLNDLKFIDPKDIYCVSGDCTIARNGRPYYIDDNHLSYEGSKLIIPAVIEAFEM
jgi:peptidoglycan/LPS O-acetylase OafA/YrhL